MGRKQQDVTQAELAVLKVLWDMDRATVREILSELYPKGDSSEYATVQKLLERLEAKGFVRRDRRSYPQVFISRVDRENLISRRLKDVAESLCNGSLTPLLTQLIENEQLSPENIEALRKVIDQAKSKSRK